MDAEIRNDFLVEARDLLTGTEKCFLALEKNPSDLENLNLIFRLAHNLKGSSGAVGFMDLADFTHKFESLLLTLKEGRLAVTKSIVDLLLRTNDYLISTVEALQKDHDAKYANADLTAEVVLAMEGKLEEKGDAPAQPAEPIDNRALPMMPVNAGGGGGSQKKDENIRVSLARIEKLLNNVGELSILQAVMVQQGLSFGS